MNRHDLEMLEASLLKLCNLKEHAKPKRTLQKPRCLNWVSDTHPYETKNNVYGSNSGYNNKWFLTNIRVFKCNLRVLNGAFLNTLLNYYSSDCPENIKRGLSGLSKVGSNYKVTGNLSVFIDVYLNHQDYNTKVEFTDIKKDLVKSEDLGFTKPDFDDVIENLTSILLSLKLLDKEFEGSNPPVSLENSKDEYIYNVLAKVNSVITFLEKVS